MNHNKDNNAAASRSPSKRAQITHTMPFTAVSQSIFYFKLVLLPMFFLLFSHTFVYKNADQPLRQYDEEEFIPEAQLNTEEREFQRLREMVEEEKCYKRNPEEKRGGREKLVYVGKGPIKIYTALFLENLNAQKQWSVGKWVVWVEAKMYQPKTCLFPCKGHGEHLTNPALVKDVHSWLNGMLYRWRQSAMDLLRMVLEDPKSPFEKNYVRAQYNFASLDVLKAIAGIAEFTTFPVHILSKMTLVSMIKGIDNDEMADFVLRMSRSRLFTLMALPKFKTKRFDMATRFDMDNEQRIIYGVKRIKPANKKPIVCVID